MTTKVSQGAVDNTRQASDIGLAWRLNNFCLNQLDPLAAGSLLLASGLCRRKGIDVRTTRPTSATHRVMHAKRTRMATRAKGGFKGMLIRCAGSTYAGGVDDQGRRNVAFMLRGCKSDILSRSGLDSLEASWGTLKYHAISSLFRPISERSCSVGFLTQSDRVPVPRTDRSRECYPICTEFLQTSPNFCITKLLLRHVSA